MGAINDILDQGLRAVDPRAPVRAQERGQESAMQGQSDALAYLQAREELPLQYRDQALQALGDYFLGGRTNKEIYEY